LISSVVCQRLSILTLAVPCFTTMATGGLFLALLFCEFFVTTDAARMMRDSSMVHEHANMTEGAETEFVPFRRSHLRESAATVRSIPPPHLQNRLERNIQTVGAASGGSMPDSPQTVGAASGGSMPDSPPQAPCCPPDAEPFAEAPKDYIPKGRTLTVTASDGTSMRLYLVGQENAGSKMGIIVAHDIFGGESGRHKQICDQLAAQGGYVVAMPDLFHGLYDEGEADLWPPAWKVPFYLPQVFGKLAPLKPWSPRGVGDDVRIARAELAKLGVERVGMVGFCYGAYIVMRASAEGELSGMMAGVSVHPSVANLAPLGPVSAEDIVRGCRCPQLVLSTVSEPAAWRSGGAVGGWLAALPPPLGKQSRLEDIPPQVRHGFATRGNMADPDVAREVRNVFAKTLEFFDAHLKNPNPA